MEQIRPQQTIEMPEEFRSVQNKLLKEFPKEKIEGINTERVEEFIKEKGMEIKPYIVVEKEDLTRMQDIIGCLGSFGEVLNNELVQGLKVGGLALYQAEMDLVIALRHRDAERVNGGIFTERMLVHELAHASSGHRGYTKGRPGLNLPVVSRKGFCLSSDRKSNWGELIEEGWAEMQHADYFARYATQEERARIESALRLGTLGMEDTIPTGMALGVIWVNVSRGEPLPLPVKYIFLRPDGTPGASTASLAGYALEILCKKNPSLAPAMVGARQSSEGLRKFARILHETSPELYKKLQVGDYSAREFYRKLDMVINKVGGGIENVIKAEGSLKEKWDKILKNEPR